MKPLAIWFAGVVIVFAVFAVITNNVRETERVFVVVDSSFEMEGAWTRVAGELDRIDDERFAEFALATEKQPVHSWASELSIGPIIPFAPCGFEEVEGYQEFSEADQVILITTPTSCDTSGLSDEWTIIELNP